MIYVLFAHANKIVFAGYAHANKIVFAGYINNDWVCVQINEIVHEVMDLILICLDHQGNNRWLFCQ